MSTSNADIIDTLSSLLEAAGYRFHNGDADSGDTVQDESGQDWWFTWAAPRMAEPECGETCASMEAAYADAMRHFFANAKIETYTGDEDDDAAPVALAIPLLQQCERFMGGFEGDELQSDEPIDELLKTIRNVIGSRSHIVPRVPNEAALCSELEGYCRAEGLPFLSADDLLATLTDDTDEHKARCDWLRDYCQRWEALDQSRDEMEAAYSALAQIEGWALFNDDADLQHDDELKYFDNDADAEGYVRRMAAAGSPVHAYALERLQAGQEKARGPFYVMIDGEQSVAQCETLAQARSKGRALADAERLPCTFSIQDADENHIEDIKRTDGAQLPALVNAFNAAHPAAKVFEVTAAGFDGTDDETDDRVYWVLAESREQVAEAIKDCDALLRNQWDEQGDAGIDFDLRKPGEAMQFGTKLLEWASHERNKNRAV